jgi:hypothetical protein
MINVLDFATKFSDQWVVLDRSQRVIDHGNDLQSLCRKHRNGRCTFYFASGSR